MTIVGNYFYSKVKQLKTSNVFPDFTNQLMTERYKF